MLGSVTRATKCLEVLPLAQREAVTVAALRAVHSSAPPRKALTPTTAALHVSLEVFPEVLHQLPKGAAAGPSGWTCEHVQAATQTPDSEIGSDQRYYCWWLATLTKAAILRIDWA